MELHRIVVGVDDSDGAREALRWALELAAALGAEVETVHAYDFHPAWIDYDEGAEGVERWRKRAEEAARTTLQRVLADTIVEPTMKIEETIVASDAGTALIERAHGADLLVVGSRGRGAFTGLLLGSVSRRCIEHAPCPVVVVRGPDKAP